MPPSKPRVLLTNDDGPPDSLESPYILGLYHVLTRELGWDVKVVLPSSQKSWIGRRPREDGKGEILATSRPLQAGEIAEWILLDGTPATCANVGLHNLFPGQIDLVISGPNLGRNTSAAFALSSGTVGAALSSSLSKIRSIAISYGTVLHPTPVTLFEPAHILGSRIIQHLWGNWGLDQGGLRNGEVDLYNVNIPLIEGLLSKEGLEICWTTIWRNSYGRLFRRVTPSTTPRPDPALAGPDAEISDDTDATTKLVPGSNTERLMFKFAPDMSGLITPSFSTLPAGSDGWAIHQGWVSVTPIRASYGEPPQQGDIEDRMWKLKL